MKINNLYIISFFLSLFFGLISCKNSSSPQAVAESFVVSYSTMDYETARGFSTKATWDFLEVFEYYTSELPEEDKKQFQDKKIRFRVIEQVKETDTSVVITYSAEPQLLPFNKLRLVSHVDKNGRERWKVDISTVSIIEGEDIYMLPDEAMLETPQAEAEFSEEFETEDKEEEAEKE